MYVHTYKPRWLYNIMTYLNIMSILQNSTHLMIYNYHIPFCFKIQNVDVEDDLWVLSSLNKTKSMSTKPPLCYYVVYFKAVIISSFAHVKLTYYMYVSY